MSSRISVLELHDLHVVQREPIHRVSVGLLGIIPENQAALGDLALDELVEIVEEFGHRANQSESQ